MIWNEHKVLDGEENSKIRFDIWKGAYLDLDIKNQTFEYQPPEKEEPPQEEQKEEPVPEAEANQVDSKAETEGLAREPESKLVEN